MTTPDTTFPNLKDWLDQTLPWLRFDGAPNMLQNPHTQLLEMMWNAGKENRASEIWDLIDKLEELAGRAGDPRAQGEILINCAKIAADLANMKSALYYFQGARSKYTGFPHQHAVVLWMMGCMNWHLGEKVDGITAWQSAIVQFETLQKNEHVNSDLSKWYLRMLYRMKWALRTAIEKGRLPNCILSTSDTSLLELESMNAQAAPEADRVQFEGDSLLWLSTQVSEVIPAGGFGPAGYDPHPISSLEISEVVIEEEAYEVISVEHPLTRRNRVEINSQRRYHVMCVTGTSMNDAKPVPILDGDFVLVRLQSDADDNDIVVVGIQGLDSRATIKRLRKRNGQIQLVPETTDPVHSEIDWEQEYDEHDEQIQIIGVVEAIFRRKNGR